MFYFFFFKQKTAYEMRISDWSSDMIAHEVAQHAAEGCRLSQRGEFLIGIGRRQRAPDRLAVFDVVPTAKRDNGIVGDQSDFGEVVKEAIDDRSEEHTSELQSLMRITYAVFCLKKKKTKK